MKSRLLLAAAQAMAAAVGIPDRHVPSHSKVGRRLNSFSRRRHYGFPHQGAREIARRKSQIERGILQSTPWAGLTPPWKRAA